MFSIVVYRTAQCNIRRVRWTPTEAIAFGLLGHGGTPRDEDSREMACGRRRRRGPPHGEAADAARASDEESGQI